ncbi:ABC transporter permease [Microbacterium esteraromaticum]|uniref:ABC transporter permease n=1 Tax=Microbacterium esteraromaticum TaxID=57043 RepID=UPI0019D3CA7F|nr:ABC transporter permease [Microbacterium esteraromaticum]MBN7793000.1 ABC transporter permease [Microbacterium esteraromaticum]
MLVAALISVPVAAAAGALTFGESRTPSPQQAVTLELGESQSWIRITGGPDPSRVQAIDSPRITSVDAAEDSTPANPEIPAPTDLREAGLPADTETIAITEDHERMTTLDGVAGFPVLYGDSWDRRLEGRYQVVSGHAPRSSTEAMASPELLDRIGAEVGDDVELPDRERSYRVVGVLRAMDGDTHREVLFLPTSAAPVKDDPSAFDTVWFLPDWQPDLASLGELNHAGYISYSRDLVLNPPAGADTTRTMDNGESSWISLALISLGLVFGGLLVGLLSTAAMTVSTRRQQRSLAVLTTVGARRSDVLRTVLMQGTLLGLAGGFIGAIVGIAGVAVALAVLDPGVKNMFWSSWGLKVPWAVGGVVLFAVLVGLAACILPARGATRRDPIAALRGARRPVVMSVRRPIWGVVFALAGAGLVVTGGVVFGFNGSQQLWNGGLQTSAMWSSVIGVLMLLLSVTLTGQGVLGLLARLLSRFGSAARLASRDAVANSPRTVPAFVSIAASTSVASFVLCAVALTAAQSERQYSWAAPTGSVIVSSWGQGPPSSAPAFLTDANPEHIIPVSASVEPGLDADGGIIGESPEVAYLSMWEPDVSQWIEMPSQPVIVMDPNDVEAATGIVLDAEQRRDFQDGGALAMASEHDFPPGGTRFVDDDATVRIAVWDVRGLYGTETPSDPLRTVDFAADVHTGAGSAYPVILSPAAAEKVGVPLQVTSWLGVLPSPPSDAQLDRWRVDAETASTGGVHFDVWVEDGPDAPLPWLILVLGVLSIIVIAAAAISLGLARIERREDDATLAAVGATERLRRGVSAWQAVIIAGVGCVSGVMLGVIGTWVLTQAAPSTRMTDLPVLWLLGIAIGLPGVIALVALIVRPLHPDLTRRTVIA